MNTKTPARALAALAFAAALPVAAMAQITITAQNQAADNDYLPGETFDVLIEVTDNTSSPVQYPAGAVVELRYDTNFVDYVVGSATADPSGVDTAWMGDVLVGPEELDGTITTRDIVTFGNLANNVNTTPQIVQVTFEVDAAYTGGQFSIEVLLDSVQPYDTSGGTTNALFDTQFGSFATVTVDDDQLENLDWLTSSVDDWMLLD